MRWLSGLTILALVAACGGGSGDLAGDGGNVFAVPQRALVALMMSDSASEELNGVYVTFSNVSLCPDDGGDPITLFESTTGEEVNFSNLDDEELLFAVTDDVPAGTYTKLLVSVDSIRVVGGPCEELETVVEDDEIELTPDEAIEIAPGDKLSITLAMNSSQSVQIIVDGANEQCVFEPVVNVEVGLMSPPEAQDCPTSVTGTVSDILLNIQNDVIGFVLDLGEGSDPQTVLISEDTGVFGSDGLPTSANTIGLDDELTAKGRLDEEGDMLADVVIAGEVITFDGVVIGEVERGVVLVEADEGEAVVGKVKVQLFDGTLILFDCQDASPLSLTKGAKVTVTGKVAPSRELFYASEIEVDPIVIVGALTSCTEVADGFDITVLPIGVAIEQTIFVPDDVGIRLEGDGVIPKDLLDDLLECEPLPVRVSIAPDDEVEIQPITLAQEGETRTASDVRVAAEDVKGEVTEIDAEARTIVVDETLVSVLSTATIIDLRDDESLGSLEDIEVGDVLRIFGLVACEDDEEADFYGFVLLILDDEIHKPKPPLPRPYEGCGQGFWKNHPEAWPDAYSPDDLFGDIFDDVFPGMTLMDVLRQGGGGVRSLGRHTVAALLNAASDDVHYRFTEEEVIDMFNDAVESDHVNLTKKRFEANNERGCPLDGHGHDRPDDDDDEDDESEDEEDDDQGEGDD